MTTNALTVEVGANVVITATVRDENNALTNPSTCKFSLLEPDGTEGPPADADDAPSTGIRTKSYTLTKRGTYGVTVRTTGPVTVKSVHVTTDWNAA